MKVATEQKAALLRDGGNLPGGAAMDASLVVAGGVLIVPQYPGGADVALRGLDTRTGRTRWTTPEAVSSRWATPAVWMHQGRQYLVVATVKGELRLIGPADGKVLWTVTGLLATHYSLTASDEHVFVNVPSSSIPIGLDLAVAEDGAVTGTWTRAVPAAVSVEKTGTLTGSSAPAETVLSLRDVTPSEKPQTVTIHLALDGGKVVRAAGAAGPWGQSWHEVDARGLKTLSADRIEGDLVLLHRHGDGRPESRTGHEPTRETRRGRMIQKKEPRQSST